MPEIEKPITLDLLDTKAPALSTRSDMPVVPVIETKPDSTPAPDKAKAAEKAAPQKGEKPAESAPADTEAASKDAAAKPDDSSANEDEGIELEGEADVRTEQKEPSKKSKGVQKRIDELTRQREDERRLREATEARLDRALAAVERLTGKPAAEARQEIEQEDPEPTRPVKAQFQDETAYESARDEYMDKKASWLARREVAATIAERERKAAEARAMEETQRVTTTYKQRVDKAVEKYQDYFAVAESPDVAISVPMAQAIMASEYGPEIQYQLGKNPAEAERISKLSVPQQLLALGRIEAKLAAEASTPEPEPEVKPEPVQKTVSSAPAPVQRLKGSGDNATKDISQMSMEEYAAHRRKQLAADRRPGAR